MSKIKAAIVFTLLNALLVLSCNLTGTPEISVRSPKLYPSVVAGAPAPAFMLIINDGKGSDKLVGCSIKEHPSVRGELHDVIDGKMEKTDAITIPAGEITAFKRGSLHLMFFDVPEKFDEEVTLLLKFKKSGTIEVKASVRKYKKS